MNDCELLELAAKAAGLEVMGYDQEGGDLRLRGGAYWNPYTDDGESRRLQVALDINVYTKVDCVYRDDTIVACNPDDIYAAVRLAVLRAAAEIGRSMP